MCLQEPCSRSETSQNSCRWNLQRPLLDAIAGVLATRLCSELHGMLTRIDTKEFHAVLLPVDQAIDDDGAENGRKRVCVCVVRARLG